TYASDDKSDEYNGEKMQSTKNLDKFRIHQLLGCSQHVFYMIDEDMNIIPLQITDIQNLCPVSNAWGSIFVEGLHLNTNSSRFAEFVRPKNSLRILTSRESNPAKLAEIDRDGINIEFDVKNRFQTSIDDELTLILPSISSNILVIPVSLHAFKILKYGKVHYQMRYNNSTLQETCCA
ncbi:MAG: hypothetical protein KAR20_21770, partial [Candidatus Heimdallarchaeota archaeon]|nr:hypothetical protein [Candidatus Heimdallarchaeota archaeon]